MNTLFPVFLKLHQLRTLIVGGGSVADEKLRSILQNSPEAEVTIVSSEVSPGIREAVSLHPRVSLEERRFHIDDLTERDLVILATDNPELNRSVYEEARRRRILTNVVDTPEVCDFYMSSIVQRSNLKIAISTNGASPSLAKQLRLSLDHAIPQELETSLDRLAELREEWKSDLKKRSIRLNRIVSSWSRNSPLRLIENARLALALSLVVFVAGLIAGSHPLTRTVWQKLTSDGSIAYASAVGFTAEMLAGIVGIGFGPWSNILLTLWGIAPLTVSLCVHGTQLVTSGIAGANHWQRGNVDFKLIGKVLPPAAIGTVAGVLLMPLLSHHAIVFRIIIAIYTLALAGVIVQKVRGRHLKNVSTAKLRVISSVSGLLSTIAGGGWGSTMTSTLLASSAEPKISIGSIMAAKFFVELLAVVLLGSSMGLTVISLQIALIAGSVVAAPFATMLCLRLASKHIYRIAIGAILFISVLTIYQSYVH